MAKLAKNHWCWTVILSPTLLVACLGVFLRNILSGRDDCADFLKNGRWAANPAHRNGTRQWHSYNALLQTYDGQALHSCLENRTLHFVGDSTIRQIFWAIAEKMDSEYAITARKSAKKHHDLTYQNANATLAFSWDPYLNRTDTFQKIEEAKSMDTSAGMLLSTGLWHLRHSGENFMQELQYSIRDVAVRIPSTRSGETINVAKGGRPAYYRPPFIMVPPPHFNRSLLWPESAAAITESALDICLTAYQGSRTRMKTAWSTRQMTYNNPSALDDTGIHVVGEIAALQADVLLNRVCNDRMLQGNPRWSHACIVAPEGLELWYVALCAWLCMASCVVAVYNAFHAPMHRLSGSRAFIFLLMIASYSRITDRTLVFGKSDKIVSQWCFIISTCITTGTCLYFTEHLPGSMNAASSLPSTKLAPTTKHLRFLSRSQTEEWKGWMQIVILLYHHFGMSKVLWIYQLVRLLVASYLFLTGYGHASYFQATQDFTAQRLFKILLRLNTLPVLLAYMMDSKYDFYYFPGLASLWFVITYLTFWTHKEAKVSVAYKIAKLSISLCAVKFLLSNSRFIMAVTQTSRASFGPDLDPKEFIFRVNLDMYAPYLGMLVSVLLEHRAAFSSRFAKFLLSFDGHLCRIVRIFLALTQLALYVVAIQSFSDKFAYNRWHPILSLLPISAYMLLRNATSFLEQREVPTFRWLGNISLELFVLQYHIWLAADTKGLLRLNIFDIPLFSANKTVVASWSFWLESVLITIVFVWVSDFCARTTDVFVRAATQIEKNTAITDRRHIILLRAYTLLFVLWLLNVGTQAYQSSIGL